MTTNTNMPPQSSGIKHVPMDVYDKIQYAAAGFIKGCTLSQLAKSYHQWFGRSRDYHPLGVNDIKELIGEMCAQGRVLVYQEPESKETYVMCARLAESLREYLKQDVKLLLKRHDGEVPLSCLVAMYQDEFNVKFNYHHFNLSGLDHLCQELNLVLEEEADSQGRKVVMIKGVDYKLRRKRKTIG